MIILFVILIVVACVILGMIVLVQNPKGGGLAGTLGDFSNQLMGVKQTTDVLEKGTWIFAAVIGALCLFSAFFITGASSASALPDRIEKARDASPQGGSQAVPGPNTFQMDSTQR